MDTCIEWPGSRAANGYGRVGNVAAHRFVWELVNGSIPDGLHILHRCDNPPCVNPKHLFIGTPKDNCDDKIAKGRIGDQSKWRDGQYHGTSKLTTEQVQDIKNRVRVGRPGFDGRYRGNVQELAREFGVCNGTIYNIANRTCWSQLAK